jgi:hypothetical protein
MLPCNSSSSADLVYRFPPRRQGHYLLLVPRRAVDGLDEADRQGVQEGLDAVPVRLPVFRPDGDETRRTDAGPTSPPRLSPDKTRSAPNRDVLDAKYARMSVIAGILRREEDRKRYDVSLWLGPPGTCSKLAGDSRICPLCCFNSSFTRMAFPSGRVRLPFALAQSRLGASR